MATEYKNILDRCGTYYELIVHGQLLEGQAGYCTDRHSILYRRRSTETVRPGEIDEFRCVGFLNPSVNTTGITVDPVPSSPAHAEIYQVNNNWAGKLAVSTTDKDSNNVLNVDYLTNKIISGDDEISISVVKSDSNDIYSPELLKFEFNGLRFIGEWYPYNNYEKNNIVFYNYNLYVCTNTINNSNVSPDLDTSHWVFFATKNGSGIFLALDGSNSLMAISDNLPYDKGRLFYSEGYRSIVVHGQESDLPLIMNREVRVLMKNMTGSTIPKGSAVYANGFYNGFPTMALSLANSLSTAFVAGITMKDIPAFDVGEVITSGVLELDLTGFSDGEQLWLSDTIPGKITNVSPMFPNYLTYVGRACRGGSNGLMLVERSTLPTIASSSGFVAQYSGVHTFLLSLISSSVNIFSGNAQIWTSVVTPYDTVIDRMSAFVTQSQNSVETIRFGVTDMYGNLIAQTEQLSISNPEAYRRPDTTGIKTLAFSSPVTLYRNNIYYFTIAGKINGIAFGGYSGLGIGSPAIALSYESINARYDDGVTGIYPTMQSAYPSSLRAWMMAFKQ